SATSFPKPPEVTEAMVWFAAECGASAGRGAYAEAKACGEIIATCRRRVAELIGAEGPERIVFTMNCSEALVIAIRGLLNTAGRGAHAIATAMEHNSVLRPYNALGRQVGLDPQFVPCDPRTGLVDPDDVRRAVRGDTKLIACVHISNVTGTIQPIRDVAQIARRHDVPCLIDAAQSVGHVQLDVQQLAADFVAFSGHKGLLGPLGTGALYIRPGAENRLPTMKEGGTGTVSEQAYQPTTMPDCNCRELRGTSPRPVNGPDGFSSRFFHFLFPFGRRRDHTSSYRGSSSQAPVAGSRAESRSRTRFGIGTDVSRPAPTAGGFHLPGRSRWTLGGREDRMTNGE
ncbi:MAG: aminotransferase class V-fold PLP-dependent enzyme, partial [Phycisphaerae bacterium]|nr:aminotransferase class V-fold PLP-dependent enzyme [Phycisphaerae bacterium]